MVVYISYLKLVTQTERMPASAAARHATGTTSETCFLILALQGSTKYNISFKKTFLRYFKFLDKLLGRKRQNMKIIRFQILVFRR